MNEFLTYGQVSDLLLYIADNNIFISRSKFSHLGDIEAYLGETNNDGSKLFPLIFAAPSTLPDPITTSVDGGTSLRQYNFTILYMDLLNENIDNQTQIWSDGNEVARDFNLQLNFYSDQFDVSTFTTQTFTVGYSEYCAGVQMNVSIELPMDNNLCAMPEREPFNFNGRTRRNS